MHSYTNVPQVVHMHNIIALKTFNLRNLLKGWVGQKLKDWPKFHPCGLILERSTEREDADETH